METASSLNYEFWLAPSNYIFHIHSLCLPSPKFDNDLEFRAQRPSWPYCLPILYKQIFSYVKVDLSQFPWSDFIRPACRNLSSLWLGTPLLMSYKSTWSARFVWTKSFQGVLWKLWQLQGYSLIFIEKAYWRRESFLTTLIFLQTDYFRIALFLHQLSVSKVQGSDSWSSTKPRHSLVIDQWQLSLQSTLLVSIRPQSANSDFPSCHTQLITYYLKSYRLLHFLRNALFSASPKTGPHEAAFSRVKTLIYSLKCY